MSGENSRWDNTTGFFMSMGTLDVLDRGVVSSGFMSIGTLANQTATTTVSGAGSELITTAARGVEMGFIGNGTLTVGDGGKVTVGAGAGTIKLTNTNANGKATLNIGGGTGMAATAAGTIDAALVQFGAGTGILNFNHIDTDYGFDVAMSGNGTINHVGSGKTTLTADQLGFTGETYVYDGIFEVDGSLGGTMDVLGGRLQGTGSVGTTHNVAGGTIAPGNSIGTLTIDGDYVSDGGALEIETVLGNDLSLTDQLVITGNSLLGLAPTQVSVINLGGLGDETIEGIKIVDVMGATSDAGVFVLNGPAIGGAYVYELFQNGISFPTDGDWYLRNTDILAPTTPVFENYPVALLGMIELPTLRQRVGDRSDAAPGLWTRIEGAAGHYEASNSSTGASYDSNLALVQVGLEGVFVDGAAGSLTAALTGQYNRLNADVFSPFGDGSNGTDSVGIGATLTWRGADGTYVDVQGQWASFSTDLEAIGYSLVDNNDGTGFAASAEVGHKFQLDGAWALTPQAQLSYASVDFDSFTDYFGSEVSLGSNDSLVGRIGLAVDYASGWQGVPNGTAASKIYGIANLTYEFLDGASVLVSGTDLAFAGQEFGGELGVGATSDWNDGRQSLHGELIGASSFEGSYGVKGTVGFTHRF